MPDLKLSEFMKMQDDLQKKYAGIWRPLEPEYGKDCLLWMMEEIGEVAAIFKKRGTQAIMDDPKVRDHFVEELSDVFMYYCDLLESFGFTSEEFCQAYIKKHERNMKRDLQAEHSQYLKNNN